MPRLKPQPAPVSAPTLLDTDELRQEAMRRKGDRIIGTAEFCRLANFNRSTLHRKIRHNEPDFPRPIRTCKVRLNFWESDVYLYLLKATEAA
jgi:predicted DNA-binding transcriptional regulator AlpA